MAQTNAEKQALLRDRRKKSFDDLVSMNTQLLEENEKLRMEIAAMHENSRKAEIAHLKAELKKAKSDKKSAVS